MVDQEATKKLHKAGVNRNIVIMKSDLGYHIEDTRYMYQESTPVRSSPEKCIEDWKNGKRPKEQSLGQIGGVRD